jgi:hypothetical protein
MAQVARLMSFLNPLFSHFCHLKLKMSYLPFNLLYHQNQDDLSDEVVIVPPPPLTYSHDVTTISWETLDVNMSGIPFGFKGKSWEDYLSIDLGTMCCRLSVNGIKNSKKTEMIEAIIAIYNNKSAFATIQTHFQPNNSPRKEIQCTYRLLNVLISDKFSEEFALLDNSVTRAGLDTGECANDEMFWKKVARNFLLELNDDYASLMFTDNDVFVSEIIDPGKIIKHSWKKLRTM